MKSKGFKSWTTKEEKFLKDNHNKISMGQAIQILKRDKNSIRNKLYQLGIKLVDEWHVVEYAYYDKYGEHIISGTVYDISDYTGIPVETLKTYTHKSIQKRLKRALVKT